MSLREGTCVVWIFNMLIVGSAALFLGLLQASIWVAAIWAVILVMLVPVAIAEALIGSEGSTPFARIGELTIGVSFLFCFWVLVVAFPVAMFIRWVFCFARETFRKAVLK